MAAQVNYVSFLLRCNGVPATTMVVTVQPERVRLEAE
jgi:hypothetical protein